jgi:hypothetical protein
MMPTVPQPMAMALGIPFLQVGTVGNDLFRHTRLLIFRLRLAWGPAPGHLSLPQVYCVPDRYLVLGHRVWLESV